MLQPSRRAELRPFIADEVVVNGEKKSPEEYVEDFAQLDDTFPDYRWRVQRTVFETPWLAVHLRDSGTRRGPFHAAPRDGTVVTSDEFALYRIQDGRIHEVWVTVDNARLTR